MQWAAGIITAPRPVATLDRSLASLSTAGFEAIEVFDDPTSIGAWPNWLSALRGLLERHPHADTLLTCEDDAVYCKNLRAYLDRALWPTDANTVAFCSPYCPALYCVAGPTGWHQENRGWHQVGAVTMVIPRVTAVAMLHDLVDLPGTNYQVDAKLGRWAAATGRSVYYHTPSLAQHIANTNSAIGKHTPNTRSREAADFVGEDFDACGLTV